MENNPLELSLEDMVANLQALRLNHGEIGFSMVNSGSFDSDGYRNEKTSCTQAGDAATSSQFSDFTDSTCKSDCSKSADTDLPSDESAIEPTPSKTEINSSMLTEASSKLIFSSKDEKASLCCSLPLERLQDTLTSPSPTPDSLLAEDKLKPNRKLLCLYCDRSFVSANLRQKHVARVHTVKPTRRVSARRQNQLSVTTCVHCDKLNASEHTLLDLFHHLVQEHSTKYFGCLSCEERFLSLTHLVNHNSYRHSSEEKANVKLYSATFQQVEEIDFDSPQDSDDVPLKVTRSKLRNKTDDPLNVVSHSNLQRRKKKSKLKELRSKKISVKTSKIALKRSKRLQAQTKESDQQKKRREKKLVNTNKSEASNSTKQLEKPKPICVNPYPEFDHFYRVKKITDHSIDNLKISSLTFDDVFDKAFFNRIKCNIEENLLHHIDGKLFKNEESENRISNFEKISTIPQEIQSATSENYGCELSLNAITPVPSLSLNSQFGEDFESQIEYGSKPSKKKTQTKSDEVHYKYFTRRKYQASILQQKENRDLSKLDMWTQMVVKERQEKLLNDKKNAKEIQEYTSGPEYINKMKREELNRILDRRGPFEDLKEEVSKKAAFDKLNLSSDSDISQEVFTDVRAVLNDILNKVFEFVKEDDCLPETTSKEVDHRQIPAYLDLRRKDSSTHEEIDKSDRIALICSSQETENYELPTNTVRGKNELVELSGEWARSRMYICAACGGKFSNMKYLLEHRSMYHQNVWVQSYEFVGNQSKLYRHLSIPGLGKVGVLEDTIPCKQWKRSDARTCTKCGKKCNSLGELHRHILECGGDWTWMLARKKCKYRPYGAKSRRKRRGLVPRIQNKQKTEPSEKKNYKKPLDGPRQRPSDADTIQRMLANLPAKRSRRSLISLTDVVFKSRKTKQGNAQTAKVKCGKTVCKKQKTEKSKPNISQPCNGRSLRSLNKVLSSRILDLNSSLIVKRKLKVLRSQRLAKSNITQIQGNRSEITSKKIKNEEISIIDAMLPSPQKRRSTKKCTNNPEASNSVTKVTINDNKKTLTKRILSGRLNLKNFFPVKKNSITPAKKNPDLDLANDVYGIEGEADNKPTKKSIYLENSQNMKKNKRGGLKGFVRALSLRKRNSKDEDRIEKADSNTLDPSVPLQSNSSKVSKKVGRSKIKNVNSTNKLDKINPKTETIKKEVIDLDKSLSKKRKLQRGFRSVINKVKKIKTDKTSHKSNEDLTVKSSSHEIDAQSFLEEKTIIPIVENANSAEVKENIQEKEGHALIANNSYLKDSAPISEVSYETNNKEKVVQVNNELSSDNEQDDLANNILQDNVSIISKDIVTTIAKQIAPVTIDTSCKPKCVPLVSPNVKGKIRKPSRGLNDCIAMLTSKLQQKDEKTSSSLESLFSTSSTTSMERSESHQLMEIISPTTKPQKPECILKIPTFRATKSPVVEEETALDLSKKSFSSPNLLFPHSSDVSFMENTINKVIEGVIEHKCKEVLTEKFAVPTWTSVDDTIQQVVQNSSPSAFSKPSNRKNTFNRRNNVDNTIDYVVNSSSDWFENKKSFDDKRKLCSKKPRRKRNSDDNLIKDIIFGKDKLIIAPSSNFHNALENSLIAKIKENDTKISEMSTMPKTVEEKIHEDLGNSKIKSSNCDPEMHEAKDSWFNKEKLSGSELYQSNQKTPIINKNPNCSAVLMFQKLAETDNVSNALNLITDDKNTENQIKNCIQDRSTKETIQNQSTLKDKELPLTNFLNNKKNNKNGSLLLKNVEDNTFSSDISQAAETSKKGKIRWKSRNRKVQKHNKVKLAIKPILETCIDDCLHIKCIPDVELQTSTHHLTTENSILDVTNSTNKQIGLTTENEPLVLENKIVAQTMKSLPSDSEDEVPLAVIAKQDENVLPKRTKFSENENVLEISRIGQGSSDIKELKDNSITESSNINTSTPIFLEEAGLDINKQNCPDDFCDPSKLNKYIVENLTADSLKENIEQSVSKNENKQNFGCNSDINSYKRQKVIRPVKKKRKKVVFGNKRLTRCKKKRCNLNVLLHSTESKNDSSEAKKDEKVHLNPIPCRTTPIVLGTVKRSKPELPKEDQSDLLQGVTVCNEVVDSLNVCSKYERSETLNSTDINGLVKLPTNSQRTRRKSKSSKKIDKFDNDLFKDFSLVINKKTKRIPPSSIVDDSVCDDVLDKSINLLVKSNEISNIRRAEEASEPTLNDSVEEMDMEIEDIPVNTSIIERNNQQIITIKSYGKKSDISVATVNIERSCPLNSEVENVTRKSPRKKIISDLTKTLISFDDEQIENNTEFNNRGSRKGRKNKEIKHDSQSVADHELQNMDRNQLDSPFYSKDIVIILNDGPNASTEKNIEKAGNKIECLKNSMEDGCLPKIDDIHKSFLSIDQKQTLTAEESTNNSLQIINNKVSDTNIKVDHSSCPGLLVVTSKRNKNEENKLSVTPKQLEYSIDVFSKENKNCDKTILEKADSTNCEKSNYQAGKDFSEYLRTETCFDSKTEDMVKNSLEESLFQEESHKKSNNKKTSEKHGLITCKTDLFTKNSSFSAMTGDDFNHSVSTLKKTLENLTSKNRSTRQSKNKKMNEENKTLESEIKLSVVAENNYENKLEKNESVTRSLDNCKEVEEFIPQTRQSKKSKSSETLSIENTASIADPSIAHIQNNLPNMLDFKKNTVTLPISDCKSGSENICEKSLEESVSKKKCPKKSKNGAKVCKGDIKYRYQSSILSKDEILLESEVQNVYEELQNELSVDHILFKGNEGNTNCSTKFTLNKKEMSELLIPKNILPIQEEFTFEKGTSLSKFLKEGIVDNVLLKTVDSNSKSLSVFEDILETSEKKCERPEKGEENSKNYNELYAHENNVNELYSVIQPSSEMLEDQSNKRVLENCDKFVDVAKTSLEKSLSKKTKLRKVKNVTNTFVDTTEDYKLFSSKIKEMKNYDDIKKEYFKGPLQEPITKRRSPRKVKNCEIMSKNTLQSKHKPIFCLESIASPEIHNMELSDNSKLEFCLESADILEKPISESTPKKIEPKNIMELTKLFPHQSFVDPQDSFEISEQNVNKDALEKNKSVNESTAKKMSNKSKNIKSKIEESTEFSIQSYCQKSPMIGENNKDSLFESRNISDDSGFLERSLERSPNKKKIGKRSKTVTKPKQTNFDGNPNSDSSGNRLDSSSETLNSNKILKNTSDITNPVVERSGSIKNKIIEEKSELSESNISSEISSKESKIYSEMLDSESLLTAERQNALPAVMPSEIKVAFKNVCKVLPISRKIKRGFRENKQQLKVLRRNIKPSKNINQEVSITGETLVSVKTPVELIKAGEIEEPGRKIKKIRKCKKDHQSLNENTFDDPSLKDAVFDTKNVEGFLSVDDSLKFGETSIKETLGQVIMEESIINQSRTYSHLIFTSSESSNVSEPLDTSLLSLRRSGRIKSIGKSFHQVPNEDAHLVSIQPEKYSTDQVSNIYEPLTDFKASESLVCDENQDTFKIDQIAKSKIFDKINSLKDNLPKSEINPEGTTNFSHEMGKRKSRKNINYNEENLEKQAIEVTNSAEVQETKKQMRKNSEMNPVKKDKRLQRTSIGKGSSDSIFNKEEILVIQEASKISNTLNLEDSIINSASANDNSDSSKLNFSLEYVFKANKTNVCIKTQSKNDCWPKRNLNCSEEHLENITENLPSKKGRNSDLKMYYDTNNTIQKQEDTFWDPIKKTNKNTTEANIFGVEGFSEMPELIVDIELMDRKNFGLDKSLVYNQENIDKSCENITDLSKNNENLELKETAKISGNYKHPNNENITKSALLQEVPDDQSINTESIATKEKRSTKDDPENKCDMDALIKYDTVDNNKLTTCLSIFDFEESITTTQNLEYKRSSRKINNKLPEITKQLEFKDSPDISEKQENFAGRNRRSRKNINYNEEQLVNTIESAKPVEIKSPQDLNTSLLEVCNNKKNNRKSPKDKNIINSKEILEKLEAAGVAKATEVKSTRQSSETESNLKRRSPMSRQIIDYKNLLGKDTSNENTDICTLKDTSKGKNNKQIQAKKLNVSSENPLKTENLSGSQISHHSKDSINPQKQIGSQITIKGKKPTKYIDTVATEPTVLESALVEADTMKVPNVFDLEEIVFTANPIKCKEDDKYVQALELVPTRGIKINQPDRNHNKETINSTQSVKELVSEICVSTISKPSFLLTEDMTMSSRNGNNSMLNNMPFIDNKKIIDNANSAQVIEKMPETGEESGLADESTSFKETSKFKKTRKNIMDIDVANILYTENSSETRRSSRKKKLLHSEEPVESMHNIHPTQSHYQPFKDQLDENKIVLCDTELNVFPLSVENKNDLAKSNNDDEGKLDLAPYTEEIEPDNSSDSNESVPLLDRMTHFLKTLKTKPFSYTKTPPTDAFSSNPISITDRVPDYISNCNDSLPVVIESIGVVQHSDNSSQNFLDKSSNSLDVLLPVDRSSNMEDLLFGNKLITRALNSKNKIKKRKVKKQKVDASAFEPENTEIVAKNTTTLNSTGSHIVESLSIHTDQEYQLSRVDIKSLLVAGVATPKSENLSQENKQLELDNFVTTNLKDCNDPKHKESIDSKNSTTTVKKSTSKPKAKKLKENKSKSASLSQVKDTNLQRTTKLNLLKNKFMFGKKLNFTALKNVFSAVADDKKNKHRGSEDMFSRLNPLTDIITSSEMDIAPVLDEIDKSLESEGIYDFNEDEVCAESCTGDNSEAHENRNKSRSKSCPKSNSGINYLLNNEISGNIKQQQVFLKEPSRINLKRSAKVKALENIHEKAAVELNSVSQCVLNTRPRKSRTRSKSLNTTNYYKTDNLSKENESENCNKKADISATTVSNLFTFQNNNTSAVEFCENNLLRKSESIEISSGDNKILEDVPVDSENSIVNSFGPNKTKQNINQSNNNSQENLDSGNQSDHLIDSQELRRSRRGSRKVASYNENDLIDPLIDALENRRNRSTKKDKSAEKNSGKKDIPDDTSGQQKFSSEELFDLLKNYENENLNILKPRNSFLENLNEPSSNTGFHDITDEDFDNILEKTSLVITGTEKFKDIDKIYEFTEGSPENSEQGKEFGINNRKLPTTQETILNETKVNSICNNSENSLSFYASKETDVELEKSNYCEICKKTFMRTENLIKHKTTLTHISKLSELEAKEAEERARLEIEISHVEKSSDSLLKPSDPLKDEINIRDILQHSERSQTDNVPKNSTSVTNNHSLNLVDIISDVLNKPVLENFNSENHGYKELSIQNTDKTDIRRYKSLGERKSFESENQLSRISTPLPEPYLQSTMSKTTILENQIHLLENIIGNKLESLSANKPQHNFIDEVSSCSKNSNMSATDNNSCVSNRSTFNINSNNVHVNSNTGFIKPIQYEEISEDSANARIHEDSKLRKTLNRDEELFLECCSLLKSGSEVSSSNYSKNLKKPLDHIKEVVEPELLENKHLMQTVEEAREYSDNSRTPTPLGDTYDDEASNSNTISSNWNLKSERPLDKNRSFSFEEVVNKEEAGISFGEVLTKGLRNQFEYISKSDKRTKEEWQEAQTLSNHVTDDRKDDSNGSTISRKISTKGARKIFEGLKVSIPTEDLNLDVLNNSLINKKSESKDTISPNETASKPRSTRKSKPVKKSQVGSNLLFKVNKKKTSAPTNSPHLHKKQDIYNFEETQDNIDFFAKPFYKEGKITASESTEKIVPLDSDNESLGYADSIGADAKSVSSVSSISAMSTKKPEITPENITKKKYKIMGKIFKNAAKFKTDEIDEELRNIPEIPEIDNLELVQNYVRSCQRIKSPFLPPPPPPPLDEVPKKPKMTEEEMNLLFDQLLGKEMNESKPEKLIGSNKVTLVKGRVDSKTGEIKKKVNKTKNRKRARLNSESSDDEFNINKTTKKRTNKKNNQGDSGINLELELKECIGVASRKSQRKCTSGKQNILVEYWSSDEEAFEAMLNSQKVKPKKDEEETKIELTIEFPEKVLNPEIVVTTMMEKPVKPKPVRRKSQPPFKKMKTLNSKDSKTDGMVSMTSSRRKRAAANPLYHWSSSSEDESQSLIEIKPIREEDDEEDRPVQHGWIVGDSPKKLVTMLALTKGKKTDIDSVKEQGKRRTSNAVS